MNGHEFLNSTNLVSILGLATVVSLFLFGRYLYVVRKKNKEFSEALLSLKEDLKKKAHTFYVEMCDSIIRLFLKCAADKEAARFIGNKENQWQEALKEGGLLKIESVDFFHEGLSGVDLTDESLKSCLTEIVKASECVEKLLDSEASSIEVLRKLERRSLKSEIVLDNLLIKIKSLSANL